MAECALLFGLYRLEAFPVDVWMKRVLKWFYQTGFPEEAKPYGGIAQQVLFHYVRCCAYAVLRKCSIEEQKQSHNGMALLFAVQT